MPKMSNMCALNLSTFFQILNYFTKIQNDSKIPNIILVNNSVEIFNILFTLARM